MLHVSLVEENRSRGIFFASVLLFIISGEVQLGHLILCLVKETVYAHFTVCDIVVHRGQNDEAMLVRLFEFTSWPEHGVPDNSIPFLEMQSKVLRSTFSCVIFLHFCLNILDCYMDKL